MMDIEKLIDLLRHNNIENNCHDCALGYYAFDAATALSTLQAENEKLRAELERMRSEPGQELWSEENQRADRLEEELEHVRQDNKKLCAAMMAVRRKESPEQMCVVYELSYDAILSHEDIQNIARIVFDGLMREDLRLRGQKED